MTVMSFLLATGQELIAQLVEETGRGYKIKSPLVVHMMRAEDGPRLGFARWSMIQSEDAQVHVLFSGLLADPVVVIEEVEASYLSSVSGILIPPKASGNILLG
jgi:hypothetical protein